MGRLPAAVLHLLFAAALVGVAGLAGCSRADDYLEVVKQQQATWEETTKLLAGVTDAESMDAAKDRFVELTVRAQNAARKAAAMGKPPDAVLEQLEEQRRGLERAANRMRQEVARVRELPGGPEFLKDIEEIARGSR